MADPTTPAVNTRNKSDDITLRDLLVRDGLWGLIEQDLPFKTLVSRILAACRKYGDACCSVLRILQDEGLPPLVIGRCGQRYRQWQSVLHEMEARCSAGVMDTGIPLLFGGGVDDGKFLPPHICVPLRRGSRITGAVTIFGDPSGEGSRRAFGAEELRLCQAMAVPIAVALQAAADRRRMALFAEENDRRLKELSLLCRISNAIHAATGLNDQIHMTLGALVSGSVRLFERAMLFLLNERSGVIQGMLGVTSDSCRDRLRPGDEDDSLFSTRLEISQEELAVQRESAFNRLVRETRFPLDRELNVSSRAVAEKRLIYVADAVREAHVDRRLAKRLGLTSFAVVPLLVKELAVGLVIVDNHRTGRAITREGLRFMQLFINQVGTAIENSMLHSRIEDAHRNFHEIQQRLIQGEKLAAIGEMAASIAHELKAPLVSMGGFAKRLERRLVPGSTEWKYAEAISREAGRLEKLLTDTLYFSKKGTTDLSSCDINGIVEESLALVAGSMEEKGIRIKARFYPKLPQFRGDSQQMKQVFINLFSNAAEAMRNGGTLSATVSPACMDGGDAISVTVSDTGGGVPPEILGNIFNPFFTTKDFGTGLGLPISHRIVANHGGKIVVKNRPGVGAQFKVILPVRP